MKKNRIHIVVLLIGILFLGGCEFSKASGEEISVGNSEDEVPKEILSILNNGTWEDDVCQCVSDFTFETQGDKIKYSSECGTFNNVTDKQHMNLTEEEKVRVNHLLGVELALPTPTKEMESNTLPATTEDLDTTSIATRIEVNSLLYGEYFDLKDTYRYEPKYDATQWMNEAGDLLFPYEQDLNNNTTMAGALALLYMPDEVLFKASTEDLLRVVMDGWLETNATSISVYSIPSHYIRSCTIKNQAANELMRRSNMVTVIYEDYCNRNYLKGEESREGRWAADKLQFDEIILASNHAFAMMDDKMKENVLNEALEKHGQVRSGYFYTVGHTSGFFAYIVEEELNGGSDWYQYIQDNNVEAAKNAINFNETCWLEQFY